MKYFLKIFPCICFWGIFVFVILQVPYPESLTQVNFIQTVSLFIPLFLALLLTVNFFIKNAFSSFSISLGIILLLILKALDSLNLVTGSLILITVGLLVSYFRKAKRRNPSTHSTGSGQASSGFNNLTNYSKIPKLTRLRKEI